MQEVIHRSKKCPGESMHNKIKERRKGTYIRKKGQEERKKGNQDVSNGKNKGERVTRMKEEMRCQAKGQKKGHGGRGAGKRKGSRYRRKG